MKKNRIICFVLALILCAPVVACGSKKETISAPEISNIYQDNYGTVYVKHNGLHNTYNPQFSIDGNSWNQTQLIDNNTVSIMTFDNSLDKFVYITSDSNQVSIDVSTIEVAIRESETEKTLATEASNVVTYKLKKPQSQPKITSEKNLLETGKITLSDNSFEALGTSYLVGKLDGNQFSYVLSKREKIEGSKKDGINGTTYDYKYVLDNSINGSLEYCVLDNQYRDVNTRDQKVNADVSNGTITFTNYTSSGISIDDSKYVDSTTLMDKTALIAFRYKATDSALASSCIILEVSKFQVNYILTFEALDQSSSFMLNTNYAGSNEVVQIMLKSNESVVTQNDLKNAIALNKSNNFNTAGNYDKVLNYSIEIKNADDSTYTGNISSSNISESYKLIVNDGSTKVKEVSLTVANLAR